MAIMRNNGNDFMGILSPDQLRQELASLPQWEIHGLAVRRIFEFPDFKEAMKFVNQVADAAEAANHHPDIDIRYNKVTMALTSHDSGGVTLRDVKMGKKINEVWEKR
jgi:4a-hydroxytetrahydrobiopterin dehydratase